MANIDEKQHWDSYWQDGANSSYWLEPDAAVVAFISRLDRSVTRETLDLGCGIGKHARSLLEAGLTVTAIDISGSALAILKRNPGRETNIRLVIGDYGEDVFTVGSFDLVLSRNVPYHGTREKFARATQLVHKWLRPGGLFFFTCPTRRDAKFGNGEEIAPYTYRPFNSIHPGDIHYFADESDITDFLAGFTLLSQAVAEHYWDYQGTRQFSSYWQIMAERK